MVTMSRTFPVVGSVFLSILMIQAAGCVSTDPRRDVDVAVRSSVHAHRLVPSINVADYVAVLESLASQQMLIADTPGEIEYWHSFVLRIPGNLPPQSVAAVLVQGRQGGHYTSVLVSTPHLDVIEHHFSARVEPPAHLAFSISVFVLPENWVQEHTDDLFTALDSRLPDLSTSYQHQRGQLHRSDQ